MLPSLGFSHFLKFSIQFQVLCSLKFQFYLFKSVTWYFLYDLYSVQTGKCSQRVSWIKVGFILFPFFHWLKSFWFFSSFSCFPISSTVFFSYFVQSKCVYSRRLSQPKTAPLLPDYNYPYWRSYSSSNKNFSLIWVPKYAISLPKIFSLLLFDQLASNYPWCLFKYQSLNKVYS